MDGKEVYQNMENAWLALCQEMRRCPTAETQRAMNLLRRMLIQVKAKMEAVEKEKEPAGTITTEEWLAWLNAEEASR